MTPDPVVLRPDDTLAVAIHKMAVGGLPPHPGRRRGGPPDRGRVRGRRLPAPRHRPRVSDAAHDRPRADRGRRRRPDLGDPAADGVRPGRRGSRRRSGRRAPCRRRSPRSAGCLVDLTARAYDGIEAVRAATAAGVPVIAVGQHDDAEARRAATDAGAARVYAYRALFEHGDRVLGAWIATLTPDPPTRRPRCPDPRPPRAHRMSGDRSRPRSRSARAICHPPGGRRREAAVAGLDALLIGVGADLRYLTGYDAVALERLTMLVVPVADGAPAHADRPRLEATPARACAAVASGAVTVVAWEETEDPMALVATTLETALHRPARNLAAVAVSRRAARRVRARAPAGAPGRQIPAGVGRAPRAADAQGRRRGRPAAPRGARGRPRDRRDRRRAARRADRGRRRPRGPSSG